MGVSRYIHEEYTQKSNRIRKEKEKPLAHHHVLGSMCDFLAEVGF